MHNIGIYFSVLVLAFKMIYLSVSTVLGAIVNQEIFVSINVCYCRAWWEDKVRHFSQYVVAPPNPANE